MDRPRFDPARFSEGLKEARSAALALSPDPARAADGSFASGHPSRTAVPEASLASSVPSQPPDFLPPLAGVVVCLDRVVSTQDAARLLLENGAPHGTIALAEEQTGGRGRRGGSWESPAGDGVWATIVLRRMVPTSDAPWLTLAGAVAACEAVRRLGVTGAEIKWPNDLVVGERKFGGVLGELTGDGPRSHAALLGFGLNVDVDPVALASRVDRPATSLRAEGLPGTAGREEVLAFLVSRLEGALAALAAPANRTLLERWRDLSPSSNGRRVVIEDAAGVTLQGTTKGIGPDGALLIHTEEGTDRWVRFGGTLRFDAGLREGADASRH